MNAATLVRTSYRGKWHFVDWDQNKRSSYAGSALCGVKISPEKRINMFNYRDIANFDPNRDLCLPCRRLAWNRGYTDAPDY